MKKLLATLALGSALTLATPLAHADRISYTGADTFSSDGSLVFANPAFQLGTASGIFAPYAGSTATFTNFNFLTYGSGSPQIIITDTVAANTLTFTLATTSYSETYVTSCSVYTGPSPCPYPAGQYTLNITGIGGFAINGSSVASGSFNLNSQGIPGGPDTVSFAETSYSPLASTPEPSSLMLMGTGLLGTAGILFRRRQNS